ncbi:hypothetical protein FPCIR_12923 [Fusarium pseudocircinatum]|uniref:Uncharacterized protein n=1 Tax=Fusarium pseudocircinatum TaxID=56676 RepID=A0A8H5NR87_9HYPO|nr:hypothetical protein FPCIR_12923 [Fusarium pseudocircinatum]
MSIDQTNTPLPHGHYRGVAADVSLIYPIAFRSMEETGAESVLIHLADRQSTVDNPLIFTYEMNRFGALRFISTRPGVLPVNSNN